MGVADTLCANGLTKEASDAYLVAMTTSTFTKTAMEGENPFGGMSDEEIVALIEQLPPPIQEEILKQLQGAAAGAPVEALAPKTAGVRDALSAAIEQIVAAGRYTGGAAERAGGAIGGAAGRAGGAIGGAAGRAGEAGSDAALKMRGALEDARHSLGYAAEDLGPAGTAATVAGLLGTGLGAGALAGRATAPEPSVLDALRNSVGY